MWRDNNGCRSICAFSYRVRGKELYETYCRTRRRTGKGIIKMIRTVLKIDGMMCGMCESHINDCIRRNFAVKKVSSSHTKGETVILSETEPDMAKLKAVIAETGYELRNIKSEPVTEKPGLFNLFKKK